MVSEGIDIPRLRVGVYATTTVTELFFRQAVGRLVRWTRGAPRQRSWLFIPDDQRLRAFAAGIAEQRRHSLRRSAELRLEQSSFASPVVRDAEQMSLFAVISAVATGAAEPWHGEPGDDELHDLDDAEDDGGIELALAPPPLLAGAPAGPDGLTRGEEKRRLRDANAAVAREIARRTKLTHAQVNAELNRRAGVKKVTQATVEQLRARLAVAVAWT
jgi:superfamily II DNA or RNA helicase